MGSWNYSRYVKCILCWDCCFLLSEVKADIIGHLAMLLAMTISFVVVLHPGLESTLLQFPCCRNETDGITDACRVSPSAVVILRFSLIYVLFYLGTFILDITTRRFDRRGSYITSNFWLLKVSFICLGCLASVYIRSKYFDKIWTIFLGIFSSVFIVAQIYTFIRLSYVIIVTLHKMEERGSKIAHTIQIIIFVAGIILSVFGEAMLIYHYPLCTSNIVFLITNALIPAIACLWSVSDCVQAKNGYSGFVQGSILTCFIVYYTWAALKSEPSLECNPYSKSGGAYLSLYRVIEVTSAFFVYIISTSFSYALYVDEIEDSKQNVFEGCSNKETSSGEYKSRVYNSAWCSFLRVPMISFIVMSCTDWSPESMGTEGNRTSIQAVWFKLVACWISIVLFIITLYLPSVYGITKRRNLLN